MRYVLTIFLLAAASMVHHQFYGSAAKFQRTLLGNFPLNIGDWRSTGDFRIDEETMAVLRVDDYVIRRYETAGQEEITLYIGYFENQREGKQIHSPRLCLPGSGWKRINHSDYGVELAGGSSIIVNCDLMSRGARKELYLWWYQGRGRIYASEYLNKLYLFWDAFSRRRTDGALIRINMEIGEGKSDSLKVMTGFIRDMMHHLPEFIPE